MFEKMLFDVTPYNTIRAWMYLNGEDYILMLRNNQMERAFSFLSVWGSQDKVQQNDVDVFVISWEFPLSLAQFFYERFGSDNRCDVEYLRKFLGK